MQAAQLSGASLVRCWPAGGSAARRQRAALSPVASASNGTSSGAGTRVLVIGELEHVCICQVIVRRGHDAAVHSTAAAALCITAGRGAVQMYM